MAFIHSLFAVSVSLLCRKSEQKINGNRERATAPGFLCLVCCYIICYMAYFDHVTISFGHGCFPGKKQHF